LVKMRTTVFLSRKSDSETKVSASFMRSLRLKSFSGASIAARSGLESWPAQAPPARSRRRARVRVMGSSPDCGSGEGAPGGAPSRSLDERGLALDAAALELLVALGGFLALERRVDRLDEQVARLVGDAAAVEEVAL